jgi:TolB-like protein/tRNA A-37 threonylcarbamoyl transferase component Bud32
MDEPLNGLRTALAARYELEREVGRGGMATVYRARDVRHDRVVAIKVLRHELAASVGAQRFLAEVRTTARLAHPHILPLFDSGDANGFLFYVMPFIEGETVRDRLKRDQRLGVDEAVRIARETADALAYAHAHGVIHRDIKPENILLQAGHALVADFGIARAVSTAQSDRVTQAGIAVGTPAYMSPEQASGESDVDGRSDMYALATVLYEMLTGEVPFTGKTAEAMIMQRFASAAPRASLKRADVSPGIDAAIAAALAREPDQRFATVDRFAAALSATSAPGEDGAADRSIAVLPFANTEEIINALTKLGGLKVAARTSSFAFKGKSLDLRAIGDQLGVRTVLEGSVRKAGNRLRITAQLINVADGYHRWSETYDRELTDVFAIQDEIAHAIAAKLEVSLGARAGGQLVKRATENIDAYDLYLKGRAFEGERGPALLHAVECFEQAIALDPRYAQAHAELAKSLCLLSMWGLRHPSEAHPRAATATASAIEHDANLAAAHTAQGVFAFCAEFDRAKASRAWARAVELDPGDVDARVLRAVFDTGYARGRFDDACADIQHGVDADPLNVNTRAQLALLLGMAGRTDEAVAAAEQAIAMGPRAFYPHWTLLHAHAVGPKPHDGIDVADAMMRKFGRHTWPLMGLALASGRAGRQDIAHAVHDELEARARTSFVQPTVLGVAATGAGRHDVAIRHLREAARIHDSLFANLALKWPGLASLHASPDYGALLADMGWDKPVP